MASAQIRLAVTVDDLPDHGALPPGVTRQAVADKMLAALKKHNVPEVYGFINAGRDGRDHELLGVLKSWREAGYPLGNHTFKHVDLNKVSVHEFEREIDENETRLRELAGGTDWEYFRYPYLREGKTIEKRNAIRRYLQRKGYRIAQVTVDFEDWSWNDPYARCVTKDQQNEIAWLRETYFENAFDILERSEKVAQAVFHRSIPHILLLHIGAFDAERLDELLTGYEKRGVKFIPLSEATRDEIYGKDPEYAAKYGSEFQYQFLKAAKRSIKDIGLAPYEKYPEERLSQICR